MYILALIDPNYFTVSCKILRGSASDKNNLCIGLLNLN